MSQKKDRQVDIITLKTQQKTNAEPPVHRIFSALLAIVSPCYIRVNSGRIKTCGNREETE